MEGSWKARWEAVEGSWKARWEAVEGSCPLAAELGRRAVALERGQQQRAEELLERGAAEMGVGRGEDERRRRVLLEAARALLDELLERRDLAAHGAHLREADDFEGAQLGGLVRELSLGEVQDHALGASEAHHELEVVLRQPEELRARVRPGGIRRDQSEGTRRNPKESGRVGRNQKE